MCKKWNAYLLWIIAAGILSFAIAAIFAGLLRMPRPYFLIPHVILTSIFAIGYFRWSKVDMQQLITHNWPWGFLGALLLGFFVVNNVLSQPASPSSQGMSLVFDILWLGVVYGMTDAILLSVIPVLAVWQAFSQLRWTTTLKGKTVVGAFAILASLFVTFAYHWGYPEYRGLQVMAPLFGNGMMSLGYLLTNNPITSVGSHIAMHVAAVLHDPATAIQMPPHYF